jgi:hypothetical protein
MEMSTDDIELQSIKREIIIHSTNGHLWQYVISTALITFAVMAEVQVFSCLDLTQFCLNETVIVFVILYVHLHS